MESIKRRVAHNAYRVDEAAVAAAVVERMFASPMFLAGLIRRRRGAGTPPVQPRHRPA